MRWSRWASFLAAIGVGALFLASCADPRVDELEAEVASLRGEQDELAATPESFVMLVRRSEARRNEIALGVSGWRFGLAYT